MRIEKKGVSLRRIIPNENKAIKNIVTNDYYPDGLYLSIEANEEDFVEVDISEVPQPETIEENLRRE